MKAVIKVRANNAVHAPHITAHGTPKTCCGLVDGHWTSTDQVISCQSCIKIMAAQVSKGIPYYRALLQTALDAEFLKPSIKPIAPMDGSYSRLEIRWIKEKISELIETVNALVKEHTEGA